MIKAIFKRIKHKLANRSYKTKREYLISMGAKIGEGTRLICSTTAFGTEPYLIEVGSDCLFAADVHIITHDGGIKVLNSLNYFGDRSYDKMARVKIGNNVYLGTGAMVMPGVTIGDNCIIGAYAVVTKNIPDNSVAVGTPAKVIKDIDGYYNSAKEKEVFYCTQGMSAEERKQYLINNVK